MSKTVDFPVDNICALQFILVVIRVNSSLNFLCILPEVQELANLHYMSYIAPMDLLILDWVTLPCKLSSRRFAQRIFFPS